MGPNTYELLALVIQLLDRVILQAPVVQTLDSAIHRINHYPADKYQENRLHYPLDRDLSPGQRYPTFEQPGPDKLLYTGLYTCYIRETNGIIRWIVICPVDSAIHLLNNWGLPMKEKF